MKSDSSLTRVADAALRLIGKHGLDAVTFSRVAVEAGVSRGLVQHVCPSRADLLHAAAVRLRGRMDERLLAHPPAGGLAADRLLWLLEAMVPEDADGIDEAFAAAGLLVVVRQESSLRQAFAAGRKVLEREVDGCLADMGRGSSGLKASLLLGLAGDLRQAVMLDEIDPGTARERLREAVLSI